MDAKEKWLLERRGKFTASENHKLLSTGASKMFGAPALKYIRQKARELETEIWEMPEMENVKSLLHGKRYEQPAFEAYVDYTRNLDMRYFGTENPIYLALNDDSGGSPDGLMGEDLIVHLGLEIKCPKDSDVHYDRLLNWKDQWDILRDNPEYYCQMQNLMMITGAPLWHFWSFDERFKDKKKRYKIIEVKPDKNYHNNLGVRIAQAVIERNKIISQSN